MVNRDLSGVLMGKLLAGELLSHMDWQEYFKEFHGTRERSTVDAFRELHTAQGLTSYEVLAASIPSETTRLLELGCGDGWAIPLYRGAHEHRSITGIDICEPEIARAQRAYANEDTAFVCASGTELPFEANSFEGVISHLGLLLIAPLGTALGEIRRVLTGDGLAAFVVEDPGRAHGVFADVVREGARFLAREREGFLPQQPNADMRSMRQVQLAMESAGFKEVRITPFDVGASLRPRDVVHRLASMYIFGTLPQELQTAFSAHILQQAQRHEDLHGFVRFEFPLSLITAR